MFLLIHEIDVASYPDNNTPCTAGHTPCVMNKLESASKKLFKWFRDNGAKVNPTKCNFLLGLEANTHICLD